jgi:hypothetical protein
MIAGGAGRAPRPGPRRAASGRAVAASPRPWPGPRVARARPPSAESL